MINTDNNTKVKRVAVGLSGGVDSAVAALLLKEQGYQVEGIFLQCWEEDYPGCTAKEDRASAAQVAAKLDIKFTHLDFIKAYKEKVLSYFYTEYKAGRTPNPDVMCNKEIKFGMFYDWAMQNGYDFVATGHFARTQKGLLLKGVDTNKDQSYFLYQLTSDILEKVLFPVGNMTKNEVRLKAEAAGLHNFAKPDSAGICFIGEVNISDFLKKEIKTEEGLVLNKEDEVIGKHDGVWFYTVGQRRGFSVDKYQGKPLFVIDKNIEKNELIVGDKKDAMKKEFSVEGMRWVGESSNLPIECEVRIRHLGKLYKCIFDGKSVVMEEAAFGLAAGQSAVFYDGDVVLGGAIIKE